MQPNKAIFRDGPRWSIPPQSDSDGLPSDVNEVHVSDKSLETPSINVEADRGGHDFDFSVGAVAAELD